MTVQANQMFIRKQAEAFRIASDGENSRVMQIIAKHARALREYAERATQRGQYISVAQLVRLIRFRSHTEAQALAA